MNIIERCEKTILLNEYKIRLRQLNEGCNEIYEGEKKTIELILENE